MFSAVPTIIKFLLSLLFVDVAFTTAMATLRHGSFLSLAGISPLLLLVFAVILFPPLERMWEKKFENLTLIQIVAGVLGLLLCGYLFISDLAHLVPTYTVPDIAQ